MENNQENIEARYITMIENNVNVSKTSDLKEFFILVAGIIGLCIFIFLCADFTAGIWIDNMSDKTQVKLENMMSFGSELAFMQDKKYQKAFASQIEFLNSRKKDIIKLDKRLSGKSEFNIYVYPSKELNAFVVPNGTIFFTAGFLKEIKDARMLTFVLAHEMAHYAHRDHLKGSARQIIAGAVLSLLTSGQSNSLSSLVQNVSVFNDLSYSKRQEKAADLFANKVLIKLYGTNRAAVEFMEIIDKKQNIPEYMHYFSTHPSPSERIYIIEHNK